MSIRNWLATAAAALSAFSANAGNDGDFGTKDEAVRLSAQLIEIIDTQGLDAAAKAVYDVDLPFVHTRMGVNLFRGHIVIADNQEPEMVAADYSKTGDLTGEMAWPRISAAAARNEDVVLKWYHYDTQEIYDFRCFARAAKTVDATVMVCR
jgi:hypothetical protein